MDMQPKSLPTRRHTSRCYVTTSYVGKSVLTFGTNYLYQRIVKHDYNIQKWKENSNIWQFFNILSSLKEFFKCRFTSGSVSQFLHGFSHMSLPGNTGNYIPERVIHALMEHSFESLSEKTVPKTPGITVSHQEWKKWKVTSNIGKQ